MLFSIKPSLAVGAVIVGDSCRCGGVVGRTGDLGRCACVGDKIDDVVRCADVFDRTGDFGKYGFCSHLKRMCARSELGYLIC